jgi:hypothetical protein
VSSENNRLRRPITLHRRTKTPIFGRLARRRGDGRVIVHRPGTKFRAYRVS